MYFLMFSKKFHWECHCFWGAAYFQVILLVTGLVTDLKHRVMVMLWKIFVGLAYHIVIFNDDIMNFMTGALFPIVFRKSLMILSKFLSFLSKIILRITYLAIYTLPDNKISLEMNHFWCTHNDWTLYLVTWQLMGRY